MTVTVMRGQLEESRHRLHVAVSDRAGRLVAWHGDPARPTTMRSCAKPFQAEPMVASGTLEAFGIDDETLAVCCASHEGLDMHADAVRRGLAACGLGPEALRNLGGTPDERLRHNCSGNHLAFLAMAAYHGWDIPTYRDPGHPAQQAALDVIASMSGVPVGDIATCTDGCGVVAFELPLQTIAAMYANLDELVPRQYAAMRAHPLMIAGPGDFDSELPPAISGAVGKGGAEALGCIALPEQGLGIALRVEDGGYRAVDPGLMAVLEQLLEWDEPPPELAQFRDPPYRNSPGDVVGFLRAEVPLTRG